MQCRGKACISRTIRITRLRQCFHTPSCESTPLPSGMDNISSSGGATRRISEGEIRTFHKDGVVCLRGVLDQSWIEYMRKAVEVAMQFPGPHAEEYEFNDDKTCSTTKGRFFGDIDIARRHRKFRRFAHESPTAAIAGALMGSNKINFFYDHLLVKEPGTYAKTPWHQDQPYWAVSGQQVCTTWIPFDHVESHVSVEFVRGSHRWAAFSPYHFATGKQYRSTGLPPLPDIESQRCSHDIVAFETRPGDCLVFHAMILHSAPGNQSSQRRRALAIRWTGDDARYCIRQGELAIPTRDPGLQHGDNMDCDDFPIVWRQRAEAERN